MILNSLSKKRRRKQNKKQQYSVSRAFKDKQFRVVFSARSNGSIRFKEYISYKLNICCILVTVSYAGVQTNEYSIW